MWSAAEQARSGARILMGLALAAIVIAALVEASKAWSARAASREDWSEF